MRKALLAILAFVTAGLAAYVLVEAVVTDHLSAQIFYAIMPLVLLFSVAWNGLRKPSDK